MTATLILSISLLLSSTILLISSPMPMGLLILFMSLLLTSSTSMFSSSWLAFLVFLIYISGMLILFSYFIALTPNQEMKLYPEQIIITTSSMMPMLIILLNSMTPITLSSDMTMQILYSKSLAIVPIILAISLLMALIIVVKLTSVNSGPLRPFNQYV